MLLNSSPARCDEVPLPAEQKLSVPGLATASATSSDTVFTGIVGELTSTSGAEVISVTGARSFSGS